MKKPVFTGSATALVTPFTDRGVDYDRLAAALDRQAEGGTAAVVVCGTTGEAATLSEAERASIIEFTAVYTRSRMKVIAGIGGNDTLAAANAARRAERLGADALLLTTPYYNKTSSEGIVRHFAYVAEHSELPLIVYNVPGRTGVSCTPEHYARLAEIPRINGVKEASGDISLVSRTRHLCGDALNIWSGNDDQTLPMLALGAKGVISVASNIVPQVMATLCAAALSGDFFTARRHPRGVRRTFRRTLLRGQSYPGKNRDADARLGFRAASSAALPDGGGERRKTAKLFGEPAASLIF